MSKSIITMYSVRILLLSSLGSAAIAETIPIRHGQYVVASVSCSDAPNAAILTWDGKGLSGAHSSACTSRASHRSGGRYDVTTVCAALGDGSSSADSRSTDSSTLKVLSFTKFVLTKANTHDLSYRWCSTK